MSTLRVVIAGADPLLCAQLVAQVEQLGHSVAATAQGTEDLLRLVEAHSPGAAVVPWLPTGLPDGDLAIEQLARVHPSLCLVALVDQRQAANRFAALAAGAWSCLLTPASTVDLLVAFEQQGPVQAAPEPVEAPTPLHAAAPTQSASRSAAGRSLLKRAV